VVVDQAHAQVAQGLIMAAAIDTMPSLRPMRETDVEHVIEIELRAYDFPWTQQIFRDCLRAGYHGFVLDVGGFIIGYFMLSVAAGEAHVLNVCVDPAEQGKGHGRRLIRRAMDVARWHRVERIFLEVRPSNPIAIKLYDDIGFNEIGRRPKYYPAKNGREDAIVMAYELLPEE
jgi:[ribosomal protein S18]-alanine N-acetyltransferase